LTGVTASVTAKDAGSYTPKATGVDKNNDRTFFDGALDIAKAKATVTANSVQLFIIGKIKQLLALVQQVWSMAKLNLYFLVSQHP
jgi:hypothetical protein